MIEHVPQRKGDGVGIADDEALAHALEARPTLGADPATMVRSLCRDGDGVQIVVGPPGTGKTFALEAAREAWQASGFVASGRAVARQAAQNLWDTARAWLDDAGLLGTACIELPRGEFAGERVVLKLNDRRAGAENGNRGWVTARSFVLGKSTVRDRPRRARRRDGRRRGAGRSADDLGVVSMSARPIHVWNRTMSPFQIVVVPDVWRGSWKRNGHSPPHACGA